MEKGVFFGVVYSVLLLIRVISATLGFLAAPLQMYLYPTAQKSIAVH